MRPLRQQVERYLSETNREEWQSIPDEYANPEKEYMVMAARRMKADGLGVDKIEKYTSLTAEEIESYLGYIVLPTANSRCKGTHFL